MTMTDLPTIKTVNVSTKDYQQTYCIMKSSYDASQLTASSQHDVLFRFGSWCYSGRVQLVPMLSMADLPFVIPALRLQQSRLDFFCDVNYLPTTSPFAPVLTYMKKITPCIDAEIAKSEDALKKLIERLTSIGLGESVVNWLEGDASQSFFEFKLSPDSEYRE